MDGIRPPTPTTEQKGASQEPASMGPDEIEPQLPQTRPNAEPQKPRISTIMGLLLVGTALLFDGGQFVLEYLTGLTVILLPLGIAGAWVIDIIAWLTFFLWFHSLGLGTIKKGGGGESALNQTPFAIIAFAFGIEFIPFINALPAWTASIIIVIIKEWALTLAKITALPGATSLIEKMTGGQKAPAK